MRKNDNAVAIYSRKSKFTGKGESIGNQVELCKEYIRLHYGEEMLEHILIYEDEGFSGGNLNRPAFKDMMKAAKEKKFNAIIVYRLDRISRDVGDFSGLIEDLSRMDIAFISIKEQFDTSSPMGRAMMYISSVFSQLERETIAERIRDNMYELAKTGRWLGGNTPTGYASESVKSINVDGKTKKACKLKLIPEEAEKIKAIYQLFEETDSLTATEAGLMQRGIKSKLDNYYTRYSIKAILQNPVYVVADEDSYQYFIDRDAELFSEQEEFDGVRGIMAYNRTDQEKGRAAILRPISEWIVAVGEHPGLIPGRTWVKVQASLDRNKSKAYRKPRNNEALLTGLLYCSCGDRMYPKISKRVTADGKPIYTYVCSKKERSKRTLCNSKNANGNTLDQAVIEQIKSLEDDNSRFMEQLENGRRFYTGNREEYENRKKELVQQRAELDKKMEALVDSLADIGSSVARAPVTKRIEQLDEQCRTVAAQIQELDGLVSQNALSDIEFDLMRQLLTVFKNGIDDMTVEQKRAAIRTVVRKVIWDGVNAHLVLFGAGEGEIEYPDLSHLCKNVDAEETDDLEPFADVDYELEADSDEEGVNEGNVKPQWCEDSK